MQPLRSLRRRTGALLLAAFLAPLLASGLAAATDDCCPDCPTPAPVRFADEPCHGSLFLVCCDDVATAESKQRVSLDAPVVHGVASGARLAHAQPDAGLAVQSPPDLVWSTSALRRSVVLRL